MNVLAGQHDPCVAIASSQEVLSVPGNAAGHQLSPAERARWRRLVRQQDRDDFLAARLLAAEVVRRLTGARDPVRFIQRCATCGGDHGPPQVLTHPVSVSWAHAGGVVAAAATTGARVGVDVEHLTPDAVVDAARGVTGRHFVRGEALVKAGMADLDGILTMPLRWPFVAGAEATVEGLRLRDLVDRRRAVIGALAWTPAPAPRPRGLSPDVPSDGGSAC